jgi:hypothetical protein
MLTRLLATGIALVLVAGVGAVVFHDDGPSYPERWDPRVADLAAFVERDRGLSFDHPVNVDFLSPAEYTKVVTGDPSELTEADRKDFDDQVAVLRALGVASGKIDLADALNDVSDAGTLAFYNPDDKRVRVRGTKMSVGLQVTLVHELTHALQDQHFDLGKLLGDAEDDGEAIARRALGEGDAVRIEDDYVDKELTDADRDAYDAEHQGEVDTSEVGTADVPDFIEATFQAPYALGSPFVAMVLNHGGNAGVDDAFRNPPSTEEHLFDPASFLAHEKSTPTKVGIDDDDITDSGTFGSPSWFLVLAQRIDPQQALDAALGWDGDSYARFERDGRTCLRTVFRGDTEADEAEMGAAIDAWAAKVPGGKARRVDVGGHPGLEGCDPGPDLDLQVRPISSQLLVLPATRGYLEAEATQVLDPDGARCFASELLRGITYEQLLDESQVDAIQARVEQQAVSAIATCKGEAD